MSFPFPKIPTFGDVKEDVKKTLIDPILGDFGRKKIDIDTYKAKFLGQNARAYLFLCSIQFPGMQNAIKSGVLSGMKSLNLENVGCINRNRFTCRGGISNNWWKHSTRGPMTSNIL